MDLPWLNTPNYQQPSYGGGYGYQEPALSSLTRGIPSIVYSFQGKNLKPMQDIASQMGNLANAQYNNDNPLYQDVYNDERGDIQQDLAGAIAEAVRQNRKASALGRTPLFDAERGGETQFRALTQGYADAQGQARMRAREILKGGQNSLSGVFAAQNAMANEAFQNKQRKATGFSGIADILPSLLKLF